MITLAQGQKLFLHEDLEVYQGGDFENTDLVLVNIVGEDIPKFQYQALYVLNGQNA